MASRKKQALIVGYGSAGKRHAKELALRGFSLVLVDPAYPSFLSLDGALKHKLDLAVIASPPEFHLDQARQIEAQGIPVLIEKPLCAFGQLARAETFQPKAPIWVAHNYRFHALLASLRNAAPALFRLDSRVPRVKLPSWGVLLDQGSHAVDIARWICGAVPVWHFCYATPSSYHALGTTKASDITISDFAVNSESLRQVTLQLSESRSLLNEDILSLPLLPDPSMFTAMWDAFFQYCARGFARPGEPEFGDALITQEALEALHGKAIG